MDNFILHGHDVEDSLANAIDIVLSSEEAHIIDTIRNWDIILELSTAVSLREVKPVIYRAVYLLPCFWQSM